MTSVAQHPPCPPLQHMPPSPKRISDDQSVNLTTKRPKISAEDKALKLAEREAKRLEREQKKKAKDEARARELAEKEKKDRAQLKMGNFFKKASPSKQPPVLGHEESTVFKPFHLKQHMQIAALAPRSSEDEALFDDELTSWTAEHPCNIRLSLRLDKRGRKHDRQTRHIKSQTLRDRLLEVSNVPIEQRFQDINYKLIQFHSDVRPAYFGTVTTTPAARGLVTGRCPCVKTDDLNYDYDSEADWIEGEDDDAGEELGDDDDISVASKDSYSGESDDFLDDEDNPRPREDRGTSEYLMPSILGIFHALDCAPVQHMHLQKLVDTDLPIDPFENYWDPISTSCENSKDFTAETAPLNAVPLKKTSITTPGIAAAFPDSLLPAFRKAIQGCNLTKINLVEKLRIEFKPHKVSKRAIEDKLSEVAQRQGKSQHDVWTLR